MYAKCNGTISCCDLNDRGTRLVAASRDAVSNLRLDVLSVLNNFHERLWYLCMAHTQNPLTEYISLHVRVAVRVH